MRAHLRERLVGRGRFDDFVTISCENGGHEIAIGRLVVKYQNSCQVPLSQ